MNQYIYSNDTCGKGSNPVIHILRTGKIHYSLLMPIDDPEYDAIKLLVESLYLPLSSKVLDSHREQLAQMANQAAVNLSGFQLNQPAAAAATAAVSSSPRPLLGNARHAAINLTHVGLNPAPAAPASVSGSWKCPECTFDNRAGATTCEMCGASKNTSRLPGASAETAIPLNGLRGKSAASAIPLNGTNLPAQAASSSSVVQQLVSNASRNLSGVHLNQPSELQQQIAKLQQQIPILKTQIAKLKKSDPKGELKTKTALYEKQEAQLEKRLKILSKQGGTRKRRTHKFRTRNLRTRNLRTRNLRTHKRRTRNLRTRNLRTRNLRTHKKQNKNNRKSHRKVRK
jgi:hypothetical protein